MGELKKDIQIVTREGEVNINLTLTIRIESGQVVGVEAGVDRPRPVPPVPANKAGLVMDDDGPVIPDLGDGGELIAFGKED